MFLGYSRLKFLELDIEKETQNRLIKQAMDRMSHSGEYDIEPSAELETDKTKRVEMLIIEESELNEPQKGQANSLRQETTTTENRYGHKFVVPLEVYSNAEYREHLNYAETMKSVRVIVDEYYRKHKKKHWWQ